MANIGNQLSTNNFVCDTFSGTGSQTTFTPLTFAPASTASIAVFVGGSYQAPTTYSLSGTSLIFTSAPTAGTGNIRVLHLGTGSVSQVPADGSVSNVKIYATGTANSATFLRGDNTWAVVNTNSVTGDLTVSGNTTVNGTGFLKVPSGTTAQRPSSNAVGYIRYNTTLEQLELWQGDEWAIVKSAFTATGGTITQDGANKVHTFTSSGTFTVTKGSKDVDFLVVAGGGGGAAYTGAGYLAGTTGSNSVFGSVTSLGGGGGGGQSTAARSGGSGGGGSGYGTTTAGSGTSGQGYAGGTGLYAGGNTYVGGGGGGAGAAGTAATPSQNGPGGAGVQVSINGTSTFYAGGGGGASWSSSGAAAGAGGSGGGGNGSPAGTPGSPGTTNTGGGGGAADNGGGAGQGGGGAGGLRSTVGATGGGGRSNLKYLYLQVHTQ